MGLSSDNCLSPILHLRYNEQVTQLLLGARANALKENTLSQLTGQDGFHGAGATIKETQLLYGVKMQPLMSGFYFPGSPTT